MEGLTVITRRVDRAHGACQVPKIAGCGNVAVARLPDQLQLLRRIRLRAEVVLRLDRSLSVEADGIIGEILEERRLPAGRERARGEALFRADHLVQGAVS